MPDSGRLLITLKGGVYSVDKRKQFKVLKLNGRKGKIVKLFNKTILLYGRWCWVGVEVSMLWLHWPLAVGSWSSTGDRSGL